MDPESLSYFLQQTHAKFTEKVDRTFTARRRVHDFQLHFDSLLHKSYPSVKQIWLGKHYLLIKLLLATYSPEQLTNLINLFLKTPEYHTNGVTFDSFYFYNAKIAYALETTTQRKATVAQRRIVRYADDNEQALREFENFQLQQQKSMDNGVGQSEDHKI